MDFDASGYLTPYAVLETSLAEFEAVFVTDFPESQTRRRIFERYLGYVEEFQRFVGSGFYQWIGGSFVTRTLNPRDIDFVAFVDWQTHDKFPREMSRFREVKYDRRLQLDGYVVPVYPEGHPDHRLFYLDQTQWRFDFGQDLKRRPKGIIQLNF